MKLLEVVEIQFMEDDGVHVEEIFLSNSYFNQLSLEACQKMWARTQKILLTILQKLYRMFQVKDVLESDSQLL